MIVRFRESSLIFGWNKFYSDLSFNQTLDY